MFSICTGANHLSVPKKPVKTMNQIWHKLCSNGNNQKPAAGLIPHHPQIFPEFEDGGITSRAGRFSATFTPKDPRANRGGKEFYLSKRLKLAMTIGVFFSLLMTAGCGGSGSAGSGSGSGSAPAGAGTVQGSAK